MSIDSINNSGVSSMSGTTGTNSKGSSTGSTSLNMDDFLSLLVAQLKNQDMYNKMDDTQFIAQMAQFSMLQAITDLSEASATSYGVSLIGKEVTIASVGSDGMLNSFQGIVDSVNLFNGSAEIVVEGKAYALSNVMSVKEPNIIIPNSNVTDTADTTDHGAEVSADEVVNTDNEE